MLIHVRLLLGLVVIQMYAAGLALFGAASFQPHAVIGWLFIPLAVALPVTIAVRGRRRVRVWPAAGTAVVAVLQPVLALWARLEVPALAALHPVMAVVLLILLARLDSAIRRGRLAGEGAVPPRPASPLGLPQSTRS